MGKPLETIFMNAKRHVKRGEFEVAQRLYEGVLLEFPKNPRARQGLDALRKAKGEAIALDGAPPPHDTSRFLALFNAGRLEEARAFGQSLLNDYPRSVLLHDVIGQIYYSGQQLTEAALSFERAISARPDCAEAHYNLGKVLQEMGRFPEATDSYQKALEHKPDYYAAYNNLGALQVAMGDHKVAIANLQSAIKLKPDDTDTYINLGNAFRGMGNYATASAYYGQALTFDPTSTKAHFNMGLVMIAQGKKGEAIMCFERAIVHDPRNNDAHRQLGILLAEFEMLEEAIASYERALVAKPDDDFAAILKIHQQAHICDWDAIAAEAKRIPYIGLKGNVDAAWPMLSLEDCPERHRLRSEQTTALFVGKRDRHVFARPSARPEKLRIGYFSSDIYYHATIFLIERMMELHDRDRFEIRAFSYGEDDSSAYHHLFDGFHDVSKMKDPDIAALARKAGLDIAVDLKGHTKGARPGIFAHGAAPIQIAYLGYPGTSGAEYIDYMIADRTVVPDEQRAHYSEKMIYLPDSYQANNNCRPIAGQRFTRTQMGLPEDAFVFACFNNSYKITPEEYDIWMRLLSKVPGSVLWLYKANSFAEANLRQEAEKRGIDPSRIIFAEPMPVELHLARQQLADLFLDTFNVNAHTTASDALWGGLPVLTRLGKSFAARVAGSLVHAVDLPELVTSSAAEYEERALELAFEPDKLTALRERLATNRMAAPLFDTERFVRHIEAGYEMAYDRYLDGQAPADLAVNSARLSNEVHRLVRNDV